MNKITLKEVGEMKQETGMFRVLAKKDGKKIFDYVKKSCLPRLIKKGYVVGVFDFSSKEAKKLFDLEGITAIFYDNNRIIRFRVE